VSGIQKKNLDELKALPKPPMLVKLALEPVVSLMNNIAKETDWKDIRA
jgi:hypothetical protein